MGHEYGAVTGRNRRCGWVDLVALKYAIMINGVTQLIMMKSDVLDGFDTIKACVAYKKDGVVMEDMPFETEGCEAVYKELPGWKEDLSHMTDESQFPQAFKGLYPFPRNGTGDSDYDSVRRSRPRTDHRTQKNKICFISKCLSQPLKARAQPRPFGLSRL